MSANMYSKEIEKVINKILPKFIERYESQYNFELPKINIIDISATPVNLFKVLEGNESPTFSFISVKVEIDVKDARIGRVKKLIKSLLENTLDSLGYLYGDLYIDFIKTSDLNKEKIEKVEGLIHKLLYTNRRQSGWYSLPYSDSNDDGVDWVVEYYPYEINVNPVKSGELTNENCIYDAEITLMVTKILVGNKEENEWELMYHEHDLPEISWDDINDKIGDLLEKFMPNICDYSIEYKIQPKNKFW